VLLAVILVIAAVNLLVISRHLSQRVDAGAATLWSTRLRWTVGAEIALVLVVLAAVGQMTSLQPARDVMVERSRQITVPFELPETSANLLLAPGITGVNHFRVEVAVDDPGERAPRNQGDPAFARIRQRVRASRQRAQHRRRLGDDADHP
jgi:hypothetical protein